MEQGPPQGLQEVGGGLEVSVAIEANDAIVIKEKFANMKSVKRPLEVTHTDLSRWAQLKREGGSVAKEELGKYSEKV